MNYIFRVKKSERGKRLDSFLHSKMEEYSHKKIKQAIDDQRVSINGKNVFISSWNLKPNDRVTLKAVSHEDHRVPSAELSRYHYVNVVYEDPYLLVTNKAPFIDYDSFVAHVNEYLKRRHREQFYPYLGQMHRLDKETSGLLIFTKKKSANTLADQFRDRQIRKYYLALVEGEVQKEHAVITDPLLKGKFEGGKKAQVASKGEGKESRTEYWVEERYMGATLLRILLGTGRTHQIRVHMSERGYPILGDKLYIADRGSQIVDRKNQNDLRTAINDLRVKRQMLHAHRVEFIHPVTHKKMKLEAPLPRDMAELIDRLRMAS